MAEISECTPTATAQETKTAPSLPVQSGAAPAADTKKLPSAARKKKARRRKVRRTIVTLIVILALLGGIAFGMYKLFYEEAADSAPGEVMTSFISRGSISSIVTGGGQAMPKDSAAVTIVSAGKVLEVFVSDGDFVNEGDPLYVIDSSAALTAVEDARKTIDNIQKQIDAIVESYDDLYVYAGFTGTLLETTDIRPGTPVQPGVIATLVDDSRMKLELYFSYAYEGMMEVGQAAVISIPKLMNELPGVVTEISYIRRITQEGSALFRVVIETENPGSLADGMEATAILFGVDGLEIYPYEGGKLTYCRSEPVRTKVGGTAVLADLSDYSRVEEGQLLLELGSEDNDEAISALENQLSAAQSTLDNALQGLSNYNASAPMSGTVLSCTLIPGQNAEAGKVAVNIANTTEMVIEARIDEMNVAYVRPGMQCEVMQYSRDDVQSFIGTVESVSLEGKFENGMSYFPAVITVQNPDGALMSGMYVDYNLVASQSEDCLLAPVQAVKYTGEGVCLFVRADAPPPNALDTDALGIEIPEGFYAVMVTIGISDNNNVEIIDGVEEMTEVFTQIAPSEGGMMGGGGIVRIG